MEEAEIRGDKRRRLGERNRAALMAESSLYGRVDIFINAGLNNSNQRSLSPRERRDRAPRTPRNPAHAPAAQIYDGHNNELNVTSIAIDRAVASSLSPRLNRCIWKWNWTLEMCTWLCDHLGSGSDRDRDRSGASRAPAVRLCNRLPRISNRLTAIISHLSSSRHSLFLIPTDCVASSPPFALYN